MIDDETLDRQLREALPYINDDGFTARVIANLPAARREPQWLRAMIVLGLALLGTGIAYFLSGGGNFVRQGMVQMARHGPDGGLPDLAVAGLRVWLRPRGRRVRYHLRHPQDS